MTVTYLHLPPGAEPPVLNMSPFKAVLVLRSAVDLEWQTRVSDWVVRSGCLFAMAWGVNCSSWDDSVDWAHIEATDYREIPDDQLVLTTWHEHDSLSETFEFASSSAQHLAGELRDLLIIDIGPDSREADMLSAFEVAQAGIG